MATDRTPGVVAITLRDVNTVDSLFLTAGLLAACLWVILVVLVYLVTPRNQWVHLEPGEKEAAGLACLVMLVTTISLLLPYNIRDRTQASGIVVVGSTVCTIAMLTNAILAFLPTVVLTDPIYGGRVYLIRWCEWIPLGTLMTFVSEAVDIQVGDGGLWVPLESALCQFVSISCGIVLPFCPNFPSWCLVLSVSFAAFGRIIPRIFVKRRQHSSVSRGNAYCSREYRDRVRCAYYLILICGTAWSGAVVLYFIDMYLLLQWSSLAEWNGIPINMITDAFFDVLAKSIYLKFNLEVHQAVFDAETRARHQLSELRQLMSVLWGSSSDVILISVRHGRTTTAMLSPSFPALVAEELPVSKANQPKPNLMLEVETSYATTQVLHGQDVITSAYLVETDELPVKRNLMNGMYSTIDLSSNMVREAFSLVQSTWHERDNETGISNLFLHPIRRRDREVLQCEVKVSYHEANARIAIIRDVSERYRLLEAERRAHAQTLARQRDAQAVNLFTRHEVKNGLLVGIELCDSLRSALEDCKSQTSLSSSQASFLNSLEKGIGRELLGEQKTEMKLSRKFIDELDQTLHEILDTVLAEAMARDVIHEVYRPRLERIDIRGLLTSTGLGIGTSKRFPIIMPNGSIPYLRLDPQLLRYIHRNAVSNACKYGRANGIVQTIVNFDKELCELFLQVVNEPGQNHDEILALGPRASELVFAQGSRLQAHSDLEVRHVSSGDGAWIMQKCAKTLGGQCDILFEPQATTFSFKCPTEPLIVTEWHDTYNFEVPPGTWGFAIDDSKVQRRLLARILGHAGVAESRSIVLGSEYSDVHSFETQLLDRVQEYQMDKFLVLVDENLDFGEVNGKHIFVSGSYIMQSILQRMDPSDERRVLSLVRSANDSADEIAVYSSRTHGFVPKEHMDRDRVREILAPFWADRFLSEEAMVAAGDDIRCSLSTFNGIDKQDIMLDVETVDAIIRKAQGLDGVMDSLWSALHSLKGDLMVYEESDELLRIVKTIAGLRGTLHNEDFVTQWHSLRRDIVEFLAKQ